MQSNPTNSEMNYKLNWSEAAKYGLILASVSVVINLVTSIFQLPAVLNVLLSVIKLCGSVYIVYYAMRRNADSWEYITYGQSFGFGMAVCTFSAIVCTLFVLLTYTVILPDSPVRTAHLYGHPPRLSDHPAGHDVRHIRVNGSGRDHGLRHACPLHAGHHHSVPVHRMRHLRSDRIGHPGRFRQKGQLQPVQQHIRLFRRINTWTFL